MSICPTGKVGYKGKWWAKQATRRLREFTGERDIYLYICPLCGEWHQGHSKGSIPKQGYRRSRARRQVISD